jgi:hypothetical protein
LFKERRHLAARTNFHACKNPGALNFPIALPFQKDLKPLCCINKLNWGFFSAITTKEGEP